MAACYIQASMEVTSMAAANVRPFCSHPTGSSPSPPSAAANRRASLSSVSCAAGPQIAASRIGHVGGLRARRAAPAAPGARASSEKAEAERARPEGAADTAGFGKGGKGAWFGFGPKQEREVGRLAMIGFVAGVVMEVLTGRGVLAQLNIDPLAVRFPLLAGLVFLFVGGLLGGKTVIENPPIIDKAPANKGAGLPRDPLKTFDATTPDRLTTYTRGGIVDRPDGQVGREPYVSDLDLPKKD